jgi:allantoin racemase
MAIKIRYIEPIGTDEYVIPVARDLQKILRPGTELEVVSLTNPHCKHHLEYHSYEALVAGDLVKITRDAALNGFDAVVIGCFYDPTIREAREISGKCIVVGPAQASLEAMASLANRFSVIIGRPKWADRMRERIHLCGYGDRLASFRSLGLGVEEFQKDHKRTEDLMVEAALKAIREDGAEAIILGCTMEFGFFRKLQEMIFTEIGVHVPVIDCLYAAIKRAEQLAETKKLFDWYPSRAGSMEAPPEEAELRAWNVFDDNFPPLGARHTVTGTDGQ